MLAIKCAVLALLVGQNSMYTLLRRYYARSPLKDSVSSAALLLAGEVMKLLISASLVEEGAEEEELPSPSPGGKLLASGLLVFLRKRARAVLRAVRYGCPMAVPAVTYAIMNIISYKALEMIDATVFAMVAQLKVVSTALFSWPVLGRRQSLPQWRAIITLTLAVTAITYQRGAKGSGQGPAVQVSPAFVSGVAITLIEVSLSGWINAYFEKYLKDGTFSVWGRNLQLSVWSITIYGGVQVSKAILSLGEEREQLDDAPAHGVGEELAGLLSPVALTLVFLGGGGGLLVALATKYTNAIMKAMAVAIALVVVVGGEVVWMGVPVDPVICLTSAIAVLALQIYQDAPKAAPAPNPEPPRSAVSPALTPGALGTKPVRPNGEGEREVSPLVLGRS